MARSCLLVLIFLISFATFVSNIEGRKLMLMPISTSAEDADNKKGTSLFSSLVLSALPKGTVPSSSPSKKGHATLDNEQLFERHLARIDRILGSVPSPGVGH